MQTSQNTTAEIKVPANSTAISIAAFQNEVDKCLSDGSALISVNCSDLTRVTSSHIGALWLTYAKCSEAGVSMKISSATPSLVESLKVTDLYDLMIPGRPSSSMTPLVRIQGKGSDDLRLLALEFHPTVDGIDDALNEFKDFMLALEIDADSVGILETIFYEIATNIREHSTLDSSDRINVSSEVDSFGVTIQFTDPGEQFDLTKRDSSFDPEQAIREGKTRGFGIEMVKKLTDSISYMRQDGHFNVLTVIRYWRNR